MGPGAIAALVSCWGIRRMAHGTGATQAGQRFIVGRSLPWGYFGKQPIAAFYTGTRKSQDFLYKIYYATMATGTYI